MLRLAVCLVVLAAISCDARYSARPTEDGVILPNHIRKDIIPGSAHHHAIRKPTFVTVAPLSGRPNLLQLATSLNLTTYVALIKKTHVDNTIDHEGPYTLFAPSNAAFGRVPDWFSKYDIGDIAKFHVARGDYLEKELKNEMLIRSLLSKRDVRINIYKKNGGKDKIITANGKLLNQTDYDAHNGVLHIIEGVMTAVYEREGTAYDELGFLPVGKYGTLKQVLRGTGISDVLISPGPFTLLAPTDDAFKGLPSDLVAHLLNNKTAMIQVLKNHVIAGTMYSIGLENGVPLRSLLPEDLPVDINGGSVKIGGAGIVLSDFSVSNGVIHGIDKVLVPKEMLAEWKGKVLSKYDMLVEFLKMLMRWRKE